MPLYRTSLNGALLDIKANHSRIRDIFNLIFEGVEYLHEQGVFHRDLKPANILINADTDVVISDFGLGMDMNSDSTRVTQTGAKLGSFLYMAPEQIADSKHIDHRADIYALGRMIYECYTGRLKDFVTDVDLLPTGISYIVGRCTKRIPDERYQSVSDLREAFKSAMDMLIHGTVTNDLTTILSQINTSPYDSTLITSLSIALEALDIENEHDLIHEIIMQNLTPSAFAILATQNLTLAKKMINAFVKSITDQGWSFDYTDTIGNRCESLFKSVDNTFIKARLLYGILEVGVSHNRWHVMGIFRDLIYSVTDPSECLTVKDHLLEYKYLINRVDLQKSNLAPILKELLE